MAGKETLQQNKPEVRSRGLEMYKNVNKLTFVGSVGVAVFVPALAVPALGLATIDAGQIYAINRINQKKEVAQQGHGEKKTIFSRTKDVFIPKSNSR